MGHGSIREHEAYKNSFPLAPEDYLVKPIAFSDGASLPPSEGGSRGEGLAILLAYIFVIPAAIKAAVKGIALDAKLDPEEGEDETRLDVLRCRETARRAGPRADRRGEDETRFVKIKEVTRRAERSFCRRWIRVANYREENIERSLKGKPVDNCPRLTRAKRNLRKSLTENHERAAERKEVWRETDDNHQKELARQHARREIEAEVRFHATVTIDDIECERPIISVDGEGMDGGPETVIERSGVKWPDHFTILLGAGGVGVDKKGEARCRFETDCRAAKRGEVASCQKVSCRGGMLDLPCAWLGHEDKRPIDGIEAVEFYLSLPDRYGANCSFVMFSFNYDVTMLLKGLRQGRSKKWHYQQVWEICKKKDFETKMVRNNTIFIGDYAISYIKSKVLIIHKLEECDEDGHYSILRRVTLYDVFGFYQCGFVEVVESLIPLGLATKEQVETMRENKARRNDFKSAEWSLDRIKAYTTEELRKLSVAVTVLRKAASDDGIRLNRLDGAGNLSAGMMRKFGVMRHYKGLMVKYNAGVHQKIGYHTDFGGRIELIQQGFDEGGGVYKYDEKSSYPHKCNELPSMIEGLWIKREYGEFDWDDVEHASPISMFQVKWALPQRYIDAHGKMQIVPFFALPYRLEGGGIRFYSRGWGWYTRDDVVFLKRWLETFARLGAFVHEDGSPWKLTKEEAIRLGAFRPIYLVDLVEAHLFHPANDEKPFAFVPQEFEKRKQIEQQNKATGQYNIGEKVIKLGLNGVSGKVAQSIGGSQTKPPGCYNVHYAAAIRAGTRKAIGEAALRAPHEIIQFCTDAVFSKVPLTLDEGKELGQWELEEVRDLVTVQSGVYSYSQEGGKIENKTRGFSAGSVSSMGETDLEAIEGRLKLEGVADKKLRMVSFREALLNKVPDAWQQAVFDAEGNVNPSSEIVLMLRTFMTAGAAAASMERFDLIGRWANVPKKLSVHTPGPKRRLLTLDDCDGDAEYVAKLYYSMPGRDARRCHELVPTAPAGPEADAWNVMSKPHIPKWYEGQANDWVMEEHLESEEILMGDQ